MASPRCASGRSCSVRCSVGRLNALGRPRGASTRPAARDARRVRLDVCDRPRLRRRHRVLAALHHRGRRHAQSLRRRCQPLFAGRTGGAGRDRRGQRPDRDLLTLQRRRGDDRGARRTRQRTAGDNRGADAMEPGLRRAFRLHRLFRHRPDCRDDLLVAHARNRSRADPARHGATGAIACDRDSSGRALQPRFIRRRTRDSVAAGIVAVPPFSAFGSGRRRILLRHRNARRVLATRLVVVRGAHRTHPHDGLYAYPGEPVPDDRRHDADRADSR